MKNAFTIDLEDWYQSFSLPISSWSSFEKRIHIGTVKLLKILSESNTKATFFVLGKVLEEFPNLIKTIIQENHEIACHSYSHQFLFNLTESEFENEIIKCNKLLKENFNKENLGFRAPSFTITENTFWVLDILKKHNYKYDASIYPGDNKRAGIIGFKKNIHILENGLIEAPITTFKFLNFDVGFGGAYFRILPYRFYKNNLSKLNKSGIPGIFYVHPWELDPKQPYIKSINSRTKYPHYFNLPSTENKVKQLLKDFEFTTLNEILKSENFYG